jgi:hypothetical protein
MRIPSKLIFLLCLLGGFHLKQAASGSSDANYFSAGKIPIFQKDYRVKKYVDPATKSELSVQIETSHGQRFLHQL